jgi:hypothetical protein
MLCAIAWLKFSAALGDRKEALLGCTRGEKAKEGFFVAESIPNPSRGLGTSFRKVVDVFLASEALPFASILSAERIQRIFAKHGCQFGLHGVYNTAIMVWSFLSQVLRDGKEASCQAAVARVVSYCEQTGLDAPTLTPFLL